jgi:hypothetical protein
MLLLKAPNPNSALNGPAGNLKFILSWTIFEEREKHLLIQLNCSVHI